MHAEELEAEVKDVDVDVIARECDSANSEFGEQLGRAPQPHTITLQPYIWCFWFFPHSQPWPRINLKPQLREPITCQIPQSLHCHGAFIEELHHGLVTMHA